MTLKELINRIKVVALETASGDVRPMLLNTTVITELVLPRCMNVLADKMARTPDGIQALRTTQVVAFVSGVAAWPSNIREEHVETVIFHDDLPCSYVANFFEFSEDPSGLNPNDYSRFSVNGGQVFYHQVGQVRGSFTGNRTISAITSPSLPAAETDQVVIREYALQTLIMLAASVVNGSTPLRDIGLDYSNLEQVQKRAEQSD